MRSGRVCDRVEHRCVADVTLRLRLPGTNWELAKIRDNLQRLVQASDFDFHVQLCKVQGSYCDAVNEGDRGMA